MAALLAQRMDLITAMVYTFEEEGLQEAPGGLNQKKKLQPIVIAAAG